MKIIIKDLIKSDYPTLKEVDLLVIDDAYQRIKEWYKDNNLYEDRVIVYFSKPTKILINRYKSKIVNKYKLKFFLSSNGHICYTSMRRTGWKLKDYMEYKNIYSIESIDISDKEQIYINGKVSSKENEKKIQSILKCRHENIWQHLTANDIRSWCYDITKKPFPKNMKCYKNQLQEAFNEKKEFSVFDYSYYNKYVIECSVNNGDYEAWLRIQGRNYVSYKILNSTTLLKM